MNCAGAPGLLRKYKDRYGEDSLEDSNYDADLGTAAHKLLSDCLTNQQEPWEYLGQKINVNNTDFEVDQNMSDAVAVAVDFIGKVCEEYGHNGEHSGAPRPRQYIEQRLQHSKHKILYGTTDAGFAIIYDPFEAEVDILDYKHGIGVTVEPTTSQIKYYATLLVDQLVKDGSIKHFVSVKKIRLFIIQPRNPHPKGPIRSHEMTGEELEEWMNDELIPAMEATLKPNAMLTLGPWCKDCKVADVCPARKKELDTYDDSTSPVEMTGKALGEAIERADRVAAYRDKLWKTAMARALNGEKIFNIKVVRGKMNRIYKKDAEAAILKEYKGDKKLLYAPAEFLSPAQLEKVPDGKILVTKYAFTPEGPYTIAKLTDKRMAVPPPKRLMDSYDESLEDLDAPVDLSDI